jgi:CRISPR-associated protein Cas1
VERLVLFGHVEVSAPVIAALLDEGVEVVLLSYSGRFRGRLTPTESKNVFLHQTQFRRYEDAEFRLATAQAMVEAKVRNGRHLLQRHLRNHPDAELEGAIAQLDKASGRISERESIESLLGAEGDCARIYFGAFGKMVRSEFAFTVRSRRPPKDPVNALLSFGYTLASTELTGAVAAQGLNPHVGVMHDLDYGRPSLALDILEEFRQPVVDRLVLSVVNLKVIQIEDFEDKGEGGVYLNERGRGRFLEMYHRALETEFEEKGSGERTTFRELFLRQARRMRGALQGEGAYEPYIAR